MSRKTAAQTYRKRRTTTNRRDGLLFSEARALKSLLSSNGMAPCRLVAIVLCLTMTQCRHQRGEGGMGPAACRKIAPPLPWATAWECLLSVLRMHILLERSYSTRTTIKRTNFSRRFDEPDLYFQKVCTQSQSSVIFRHHHPNQNCLKLYFSTLQETCQIQKRQSTAKSHSMSQNFSLNLFFVNLPTQEITDAVATHAYH